jgi:hypothetical protein
MIVIASHPNPARYRTPTLNKKHRHREERSVAAIHEFRLHGLPRFARNDSREAWIAALRSQ